jgi:DNA-binding NarL/FixJ family response regulator
LSATGGSARDPQDIRLLVAQPHELLLEGLQRLLEEAGLRVSDRCTCPAELERCLRSHAPEIALVDTDLAGGGDVRELVSTCRRSLPEARLVLLVPGIDPMLARETLELEVDGVVLKSASADDAVAALRRVVAGDAVYPAGWLAAAHRAEATTGCLSGRQLEVLELIAQGLPNELIAERLYISPNTVKFHVAAIYQRLGVRNRVQAVHALADLRTAG